jgi:hypothetical protein
MWVHIVFHGMAHAGAHAATNALTTSVTVHGPRVTSVQRGTESQAIAGGLDFAVEFF